MRIECPGCVAAYEVPEAQIRPGRSVRCVRCDVEWRPAGDIVARMPAAPKLELVHAVPDPAADAGVHDDPARNPAVRLRQSAAPAVLPDDAAVDVPAPACGPASRKALWKPPRMPAGWSIGWAASLILLGGLLVSAAYWRSAIMQDWPASIRLYTALGAQPPEI